MIALDTDRIDRTEAVLFDEEPAFDWVGVCLVEGDTSEVVAPILVDGRVAGVLDVDSDTPDAFGDREVSVIEEAARAIAAEG